MPKAKEQAKRKAGRPKAEIDWVQVGKMLEAGCFATGIAATIGIDEATLYRRCEAENSVNFATFRQQKLAKGDDLLRSAQFKAAMGGNTTMQIWLGKQRLNQAEKHEHTGKEGGPIQSESTVKLEGLSTDDLLKLKEINKKINAA